MEFQPLFVMHVYTHFVKIFQPTPRIQNLMHLFLNGFTGRTLTKERGRWISKPDKLYGFRNKDRTEFRIHINALDEFKNFLKINWITPNLYKVVYRDPPPFYSVDFKVRSEWSPRKDQVPAIDYILDFNNTSRIKNLALYTGAGKGFISMASISKLKSRTLVMVKPMYIEKWYNELMTILDLTMEDVMVVKGGENLQGLIELGKNNLLNSKIIILSNRTYQNYIKAYETDEASPEFLSYGCHPDDFYDVIKVSTLLIDEVHQDFHANFKTFLYCNASLSISLSATLISYDKFLMKMYSIAFPPQSRYKGEVMEKYIKMFPVSYRFKEPNKIRVKEFGSDNYSHIAFEKSIMYRPWVLDGYLKLISFIVDTSYIKEYLPKDKCVIFASSVKFCTILTEYLKKKYPDKVVKRYVEDDPLDNILTCDIGVTTIISGGTALDIPDLRVTINTINIDSAASNIQTRGRLRKLKDRDVKYFYTYCEQIPKHKEYHGRRVELLKETTLAIKDYPYTILI